MDPARLDRYKSTLVQMRERLMHEVSEVENAVVEDAMPPGEISNAPTHIGNIAGSNADVNITLAENEGAILENVEAALERIEKGTFGRCEACKREIPAQRLDAIPYTPICADCARRREQEASS